MNPLVLTVKQRLAALDAERRSVWATKCAVCRHPYVDHTVLIDETKGGKCFYPRVRALAPSVPACRCRVFVDPAERVAMP